VNPLSSDTSTAALRAVLRAEEQLSAAVQALDRGGADTREAAMTALRAAHGRLARTLHDLAHEGTPAQSRSVATATGGQGTTVPSLADLVRQTASELETVRASVRAFGEGLPEPAPPLRQSTVAGILETRLGNVEERLHGIEHRVRLLERLQLGLS
jgi:hypothetical protein